MKKVFLAAVALGVISFSSCDTAQNNTNEGANTTETGTVSDETDPVDRAEDVNENNLPGSAENMADFMMEAANSNMAEIALGKMAAEKATDPEVKQFGQMMATDHGKASEEMKALAASKNVTLPTGVSEDMQKKQTDLARLTGAEFDKEYINLMVDAHEKDVEKFKEASENLNDAETKAFAAKTLPVLQAHLDQVKKIDQRLENK